MERRKRYNETLWNVMDNILQKNNATFRVDPIFYREYAMLSDEEIKSLVKLILRTTYQVINENVLSGKWKDDEDIDRFVMCFMELVFEGKGYFDLESGIMYLTKPLGEPPTDKMWRAMQSRIRRSKPIIADAIFECLGSSHQMTDTDT